VRARHIGGREGIREPVDSAPTSDSAALAKELRRKVFAADGCYLLCRAPFHQHHPTYHRVRAATVVFLLGRDLAHRRVRIAQVRADYIGPLDEPRLDYGKQLSRRHPREVSTNGSGSGADGVRSRSTGTHPA
jgi:hypothetical protein